MWRRTGVGLALLVAVAGCAPASVNAPLVEGPAVEDIVTPFEDALMCLNGKVDSRLSFGVGGIPDQTGRETNSNEGTGRMVTQGAGDIVQSALFKAGVTVINRRDMGSAVMESQWGIRALEAQQPAHLVITGSINSLDFLPGGGAIASVRGVGPRYRQHRILVGFDLALTNNNTGQILANIALHKQIFADELGFGGTRFVDDDLLDADIGFARREAVHLALRQMLQLATFELLVQLMPPERYKDCADMIDPRYGKITGGRTSGEQLRQLQERLEKLEADRAAALAAQEAAEVMPAATEPTATDVAPVTGGAQQEATVAPVTTGGAQQEQQTGAAPAPPATPAPQPAPQPAQATGEPSPPLPATDASVPARQAQLAPQGNLDWPVVSGRQGAIGFAQATVAAQVPSAACAARPDQTGATGDACTPQRDPAPATLELAYGR